MKGIANTAVKELTAGLRCCEVVPFGVRSYLLSLLEYQENQQAALITSLIHANAL